MSNLAICDQYVPYMGSFAILWISVAVPTDVYYTELPPMLSIWPSYIN